MKHISKIILFLLVNAAGFLSAPLCLLIGAKLGLLENSQNGIDAHTFQMHFLMGTYLTWAACALFSFAYFFLKGKEKLVFLWAPVVMPMAYGLYVLSRLVSS